MPRTKYVRRPAGVITADYLERVGACRSGVRFFRYVFPAGTPETHREAFAAIDKALSDINEDDFSRVSIIGWVDWMAPRVAGSWPGGYRGALYDLYDAPNPTWRQARTALRYLVKGFYNAEPGYLSPGLAARVGDFEFILRDLRARASDGDDVWQYTQDCARDMYEEARKVGAFHIARTIREVVEAEYGIEL